MLCFQDKWVTPGGQVKTIVSCCDVLLTVFVVWYKNFNFGQGAVGFLRVR